jgi:hypothetical protein
VCATVSRPGWGDEATRRTAPASWVETRGTAALFIMRELHVVTARVLHKRAYTGVRLIRFRCVCDIFVVASSLLPR